MNAKLLLLDHWIIRVDFGHGLHINVDFILVAWFQSTHNSWDFNLVAHRASFLCHHTCCSCGFTRWCLPCTLWTFYGVFLSFVLAFVPLLACDTVYKGRKADTCKLAHPSTHPFSVSTHPGRHSSLTPFALSDLNLVSCGALVDVGHWPWKIIRVMVDKNGALQVTPMPIFMCIYRSMFIGQSSSSSLSMGPVMSMTLSSCGRSHLFATNNGSR